MNRRPKCTDVSTEPGERILGKHVKNPEMEKETVGREEMVGTVTPRYTAYDRRCLRFRRPVRIFIWVFDGKSICFVLSDGDTRFDRSRGNRCSFRQKNQKRSHVSPTDRHLPCAARPAPRYDEPAKLRTFCVFTGPVSG